MVSFEWNPDHTPMVKLVLHSVQIFLSFIAWCLEIAVFRGEKAKITGNNGWTFAVMFLSIPAWLYLVGTPRFQRTRKFALAPVMLGVDGLFTVIWLSAFATQASYNSANQCGKVCGISKGIVALGVLITLLFGATTFVSAYTFTYYNFHGSLPGYENRQIRGGENIDPDKAAFSMAPHDDEAYERVHMDDHEGAQTHYDGGGSIYGQNNNQSNPFKSEEDDHPDHPDQYGTHPAMRNTFDDDNADYGSGIGNAGSSMGYGAHQTTYNSDGQEPTGPAQFPSGNYDSIHR